MKKTIKTKLRGARPLRTAALLAAAAALVSTAAFALIGCSGSTSEGHVGSSGSVDSSEHKTLRVAMELAYPPFETRDESGNPSGVSVAFMESFGKAYGYDVKIENTAFDGLIPALQSNLADCAMSSITITEAREEQVDFTEPYAIAQLAILANAESDVSSAEDLDHEGKTVVVKTGSTGDVYATSNLSNAEIIRLADESACVTEVVQGRADGFLYDQLTIYRNNIANPETTKAVFIPFQDAEHWGIAMAKGNEVLKSQLNEFIASCKNDGTFDRLSEEYLSEENAAFDELGFRWFFDFDPDQTEADSSSDAKAKEQ